MDYIIWGWAAVFDPAGVEVRDTAVFRRLSGFLVDLYATDYLGGTEAEETLLGALERSGQLLFVYEEGDELMRVVSTFRAKRPLSDSELALLVRDTLGQWSDGMGECVSVQSGPLKDYGLQPLSEHEVTQANYPFVKVEERRQGGRC